MVLEKSIESIANGEKDKHNLYGSLRTSNRNGHWSRVPKATLSYFGHVMRAGGMEDDVMLGRMNGVRRRGR